MSKSERSQAETRRLVLASGSPRRRQLLAEAGWKFEVINPDVVEIATPALSIAEITSANATRKAVAVARSFQQRVVLGADTLVGFDGEVIGKPVDLNHAFHIVRRLSGNEHQVCTSVSIHLLAERRSETFSVMSHVRFRSLTEREIRKYLAKVNPLDKAGAYAAQGHGADIIQRITGSYTNVVGLPMDETVDALRRFSVKSISLPEVAG
jgi:septum formation protein